jgi:hypothetical protein
VSESEGALDDALYEQDADAAPYVRAWRERAGDSLTDPGATIIDITKRNQKRVSERWGKPIVEPEPDASFDPDNPPARLADALNQLHLYRNPSPSLKAIWLDLKEGGANAYEDGGFLLWVPYWAAGIPGYVVAWVAEILKTNASRPGRIYGTVFVALLLWIALAIAGHNPVPFSVLNPFS